VSVRPYAGIVVALALCGCAADTDADAVAVKPLVATTISSSAPSASAPFPPSVPAYSSSSAAATASPASATATQLRLLVDRATTFGYSVQGRPLRVTETGNPASAHRVLIVGSIHGNELAGDQIAAALQAAVPRPDADLWIVPQLNPDGAVAATRQNAHGVDLNRNFPFHWQSLGSRGSLDYSGSRALSEPESVAAADLIGRIHPTLAIWFHQHLAVVDDSQGPTNIERQFSALVGLPLARLIDYPGSVSGWQNSIFGPTAFVVELPAGRLAPQAAQRYADAIEAVARLN
jgi:murein peptide amidase A